MADEKPGEGTSGTAGIPTVDAPARSESVQEDPQKATQSEEQGAAEPAPLKGDALELARLRAVIESGVPHELADILGGSTAEELSVNAGKLAEFLISRPSTPVPSALKSRPVPQFGGGRDAVDTPEPLDPRRLASAIRDRLTGR
ncbi:hypothetical protein AB0B50_00080 [Streptomyces sp. NPDC041068]|uniref:hypothetical protein n=1 Tax=Streptomyces sp. NPDC041068 TaxID=3155130 RepID=UPI00340DA79B